MPVYLGDGPPRVDEDFSKLLDNRATGSQKVVTTPSDNTPKKGFDINDLIFKRSQEVSKK